MARWVRIQADLLEHPMFGRGERSESDAWLWLISNAAWRGTTHRIGSELHEVEAGSLFVTLRQLQREWRWKSDKRVRSFLSALEDAEMIRLKTDAKKTQVTICNYSKYQDVGRTEDAAGTQRGRTKDTSTPKNSSLRSEKPSKIQDEFREILGAVMRADILADFCSHRKMKKASFTATAAKMFLKNAADCGMSPDKAAVTAIDRNWITVKPEWLSRGPSRGGGGSKPKTVGESFADLARTMGILNDDKSPDAQSGLFPEGDAGRNGPVFDLAVSAPEQGGDQLNDFTRGLLHRP